MFGPEVLAVVLAEGAVCWPSLVCPLALRIRLVLFHPGSLALGHRTFAHVAHKSAMRQRAIGNSLAQTPPPPPPRSGQNVEEFGITFGPNLAPKALEV